MGNLELPNRIVMAPMTRSRAVNDDTAPTEDLHVKYYTQRATAGLIITGRFASIETRCGIHQLLQVCTTLHK